LCDTVLTCAYADNIKEVTPQVLETAAKELQWPPYSERVERNRVKVRPVSAEGGVQGILREQAQALAAIVAQLRKLEERTPSLETMEKTLMTIEAHLRKLVQSHKVQSNQEQPPVGRQQRSG
jgi:hypothetical protein